MFIKKDEIETRLDNEIITVLDIMEKEVKTTEEYASVVDQLTKLYELRQKNRISKETMAAIGANVAGIFLILSHERAHVIASKAFGLVKKIF